MALSLVVVVDIEVTAVMVERMVAVVVLAV